MREGPSVLIDMRCTAQVHLMNGGNYYQPDDVFEYFGDSDSFKEDLEAGRVRRMPGRVSEDTMFETADGEKVADGPEQMKRKSAPRKRKVASTAIRRPHERIGKEPVSKQTLAKAEEAFAKSLESKAKDQELP